MKTPRRFVPILLLAVAAAGCGRDGGRSGTVVSEPVAGGTAVVAFPADPDVLNPLLSTSSLAGQIIDLMTEGLAEMEEDFVYRPHVASGWEFAPDSLSLVVHLRPWSWSDGVPLTAHDVSSSVSLYLDPRVASPRSGGRMANIRRVTVLDDATVRYEFRERRADMIPTLGHVLLPAHVTDKLDPADVRAWPINEHPLSNGPFELESWQRNRTLVLRRNDRYPGRRPYLDRLIFRIIPDETARVVELETGAADFMEDVPAHLVQRLSADPDVEVHRIPGRLVGQITWNLENPLFADARVRRALSHAIDRGFFVDGLLSGCGRRGTGPLPPALWAYDDSLRPDAYDPELARRLLDAAGWRDDDGDGIRERDGAPLRFTLLTRKGDPVRENGAAAIRDQLGRVGVDCRPRVMEFGAAIDLVEAGRFDAYLGVFSARLAVDPSPRFASDAWERFNYGHYASAAADSLLRLALSCTDRDRARPVWYAFQRLIQEDSPVATLYYPDLIVASNIRIRNVKPHILSPFQNVCEWWIAPEARRYREPGEDRRH